MRARLLSTAFLTLGLLVGMAAALGLLVGFEPARLPAVLLNIAAYKLTFLAALSLIASGAVLGRRAQRSTAAVRPSPAAVPSPTERPDAPQLTSAGQDTVVGREGLRSSASPSLRRSARCSAASPWRSSASS